MPRQFLDDFNNQSFCFSNCSRANIGSVPANLVGPSSKPFLLSLKLIIHCFEPLVIPLDYITMLMLCFRTSFCISNYVHGSPTINLQDEIFGPPTKLQVYNFSVNH